MEALAASGGLKVANTVLKLPAVKARTALSRSTLYNMISRGEFPTPVQLGPRAVGWLEAEVEEWIAVRARRRSIAVSKTSVSAPGEQ